MKLYTGTGDIGMTSLLNETKVSKADDRIELLGTIDELSSNIGLAKVVVKEEQKRELSAIQQVLLTVMAGIADSANADFRVNNEQITYIESQIYKI